MLLEATKANMSKQRIFFLVRIPAAYAPFATKVVQHTYFAWLRSHVLTAADHVITRPKAFSLDWKNFSSWTDFKAPDAGGDPLWVSSSPDDEDPMPWQDEITGIWHSIQHNLEGPHMCEGQLCQIGTHQFSIDGSSFLFFLAFFLLGSVIASYSCLVLCEMMLLWLEKECVLSQWPGSSSTC